jgi:hypothetical protein
MATARNAALMGVPSNPMGVMRARMALNPRSSVGTAAAAATIASPRNPMATLRARNHRYNVPPPANMNLPMNTVPRPSIRPNGSRGGRRTLKQKRSRRSKN